MKLLTLGCDPGKSGAVAVLDTLTHELLGVADMPVVGKIISATLLAEQVHNWVDPLSIARRTAVIEDVHAMPKQGVSSVFSFGRALGVVEGVLAGDGWSVRYVSPAKWKKALGLSADKGESRRRAIELWPAQASWFARVKDDGRAEAALIAYWYITQGDRP